VFAPAASHTVGARSIYETSATSERVVCDGL
jgi:hypothetical protein